ncbi:hypothetical protein C0991_001031 [Blastosporella zonata]|nr:hypothetical protein C0991_001031 [Blastosporella zonata]
MVLPDLVHQVSGSPHKASLSHELIAGAAAYEAAKAYENHISEEGKPASHEKAKEILYVVLIKWRRD